MKQYVLAQMMYVGAFVLSKKGFRYVTVLWHRSWRTNITEIIATIPLPHWDSALT